MSGNLTEQQIETLRRCGVHGYGRPRGAPVAARPDNAAAAAAVTAARRDGKAAGRAAERARLESLLAVAPDDPAFVIEQFRAGADAGTAAAAYIPIQQRRLEAERWANSDAAAKLLASQSDGYDYEGGGIATARGTDSGARVSNLSPNIEKVARSLQLPASPKPWATAYQK